MLRSVQKNIREPTINLTHRQRQIYSEYLMTKLDSNGMYFSQLREMTSRSRIALGGRYVGNFNERQVCSSISSLGKPFAQYFFGFCLPLNRASITTYFHAFFENLMTEKRLFSITQLPVTGYNSIQELLSDLEPVCRKSRNFSGLFRVSPFPL